MPNIRLPEEIEQRLTNLAKATERSKSFYLKKIILDNFDELEKQYLPLENYHKSSIKSARKREVD